MGEQRYYAFKNGDEDIRRRSTSGGAFIAIAEWIIENEGVVYGASLSPDNTVCHIRVDSLEEISKLSGSKYLQSAIGDTFKQVKNDLNAGKKVLFSGTPCQIAGLRKCIGRNNSGLYTCDIICHGVSSPLIWEEFIHYKENQLRGKVVAVCFRDKEDYQWSNCKEVIYVQNEESGTVKKHSADEYAKIFYDHEALRPSCYECRFTNINRPGDITLGDFWGIDKAHPEFYDEIGVSFIICSSEYGAELVEALKCKGDLIPAKLEETCQPQLYKPVRKPLTRNWFWKTYGKRGFSEIMKKNMNPRSLINIKRNTINTAKALVRTLLQRVKTARRKVNG